MVKLRLKRNGRKYDAVYHIVATDSRSPRDGKFIEEVGFYNPRAKELRVNEELRAKWLKNGAQPSETVARLFARYDASKASSGTSIKLAPKSRPKKAKASKKEA